MFWYVPRCVIYAMQWPFFWIEPVLNQKELTFVYGMNPYVRNETKQILDDN